MFQCNSAHQHGSRAYAVALFSALLLESAVPAVAAAAAGSVEDITGTPTGQAIAAQAGQRFSQMGAQSSNLTVWADAAGYLVVPRGQPTRVTSDEAGNAVVEPVTATAASATHATALVSRAASVQSQSWNLVASQCFARYTDSWTWMDACYKLMKLSSDGTATYDYFTLQHYATVHPNSPWVANWAEIGENAITSMSWADWAPRGDRNGTCLDATLSVSAGFVQATFPVTKCEAWTIGKDNPAVNFGLVWQGAGTRANRELAVEVMVRVTQGAWPQWSLPADNHGSAF